MSNAKDLLSKHPTRVPVHVVATDGELQNKYLIPRDMTLSQFMIVLRKRIQVKAHQAIFIYIKNTLPPNSQTFHELYQAHKDDDGMLYLTWSHENTFG